MVHFSIPTAVLSALVGTTVLFGALGYLTTVPGSPRGARWWTAAFGLNGLRHATFFSTALVGMPVASFVAESLQGISAMFLLAGTLAYLGRGLPTSLVAAASGLIISWAGLTVFTGADFLVQTIPLYGISGSVTIYTGWALIATRCKIGRDGGHVFTGAAFVLWGLHRFDYPFLRPVEWFAPWGFLLADALSLVVAMGLIIIVQRHHRWQAGIEIDERRRAELVARESSERFRSMVENMRGIVFCRTEKEGHCTLVWGADAQTISGALDGGRADLALWYESVHPEDRSAYLEAERRRKSEDVPYVMQYRFVHPVTGELRWMRETAWNVHDAQTERTYFDSFIVDITDQKRIEEQLRKLSSAVEQSPASIVITDIDGTIEYVNPKFLSVTGYSREEVIGKNPRVLKSGVTSPEEYEDLWQTITGGQEWHGRFCNRRKDATYYWELASISPIHAPDGTISHFVGVKEDITEQVVAQEALALSEEKFATAFHSSPSLCAIIDIATGRHLDVNNAWLSALGFGRDEVIGRTAMELGIWVGAGELDAFMRESGADRENQRRSSSLRTKDGKILNVLVSAEGLRVDKETMALWVAHDVTALVQAEVRLERSVSEEQAGLFSSPEAVRVTARYESWSVFRS